MLFAVLCFGVVCCSLVVYGCYVRFVVCCRLLVADCGSLMFVVCCSWFNACFLCVCCLLDTVRCLLFVGGCSSVFI